MYGSFQVPEPAMASVEISLFAAGARDMALTVMPSERSFAEMVNEPFSSTSSLSPSASVTVTLSSS